MKVLVVVDMQNDFITGPLGTPEAQAIVPKVCDVINSDDYGDIYYTMDTHDKNYLRTREGKMLPVEHCIEDSHGWYIEPYVWEAGVKAYERTECSVYRVHKGTFSSYRLAKKLSFATDIDICGVCTDICVISNALMLRSCVPRANIRVIASACAGTTPEMHQKALDVMRSCQIEVVE